MSSLARRTLRTTAAAAGIAALGAGIAGNAVAAPAESAAPTPEATSALAALPAGLPTALPLTDLPSAQAMPALPMLFVFEGPTVNTSGPARTSAPADTSSPGSVAAQAGQASTVQRIPGSDQVPGIDAVPALDAVALPVSGQSAAQQASSVPALSALDSGGLFDGLAQQRLVNVEGYGVSPDGALTGPPASARDLDPLPALDAPGPTPATQPVAPGRSRPLRVPAEPGDHRHHGERYRDHHRGQRRQQRQRAERDGEGSDETDHGSSGELDAVIGVATDTDPRPQRYSRCSSSLPPALPGAARPRTACWSRPASPRTVGTAEGERVNQHERRVAALRADRSVIERAAARLRSDAIRSGYAGLQHQHVAFGLALILDELARHVADLDRAVRWQAVQSCRLLLGEQLDSPQIRRTRRR